LPPLLPERSEKRKEKKREKRKREEREKRKRVERKKREKERKLEQNYTPVPVSHLFGKIRISKIWAAYGSALPIFKNNTLQNHFNSYLFL